MATDALVAAACRTCAGVMPPPSGRHPNRVRVYCSLACFHHRPLRGETRQCVVCRAEFHLYPSTLANPARTGEFCSKKCYGVRMSERQRGVSPSPAAHAAAAAAHARTRGVPRKPVIERACVRCAAPFVVPRGTGALLRARRRYCGKECWYAHLREQPGLGPTWRGGVEPYYGPNWDYQARLARERDAHTCQDCGATRRRPQLDVHHITPRRSYSRDDFERANDLSNLITLCKACHSARERALDAPQRQREAA